MNQGDSPNAIPPALSGCIPTTDMHNVPQNSAFSTNQYQFAPNSYPLNPAQSPNVPTFPEALPFCTDVSAPSLHGLQGQCQQYYTHNDGGFPCDQNCCSDHNINQYNMNPYGTNNNNNNQYHMNTFYPSNNANNSFQPGLVYFFTLFLIYDNKICIEGNVPMHTTTSDRYRSSGAVVCYPPGRARYGAMNCITSSCLTQNDDDNHINKRYLYSIAL